MKKRILCILMAVLMLMLTAGCGADNTVSGSNETPTATENSSVPDTQAPDSQPSAADSEKKPLSGKLSVAVCYNFLYIDDAIEKFKALHPDVEIDVTKYDDDTEKYSTQLSTDLMAGTAPDVFERSWNVEYMQYADNGMLADIKQFMDNDPEFNDDTYFMNVFKGMEYKQGVYSFPTCFQYEMAGINNTLPEATVSVFQGMQSATNRDLINLYLGLENKTDFYLDSNFDVSVLVGSEISNYIDLENKTCDFNNPEFIQLVEDAKAITEPSKAFGMMSSSNMAFPAQDIEASKKYAFTRIYGDNYQYFLNYQEYPYTDFIPLTENQGQLFLTPSKQFSMNANATDKQLAWEFLKFLTSMEANTDIFVPGLPVKREVYDKILGEELNNYIEAMEQEVGISPAGDPKEAVAAAKLTLDSFSEMPMIYQHSPHSQIIYESLQLYNDGTISAEQLAMDLQNKISIALME